MATLTALPTEILDRICFYASQQASQQSRKELGSTCHLLREVSKQWIYRSIIVSYTDQSRERFEKLLENQHLSQFVAKVYLDASEWEPYDVVQGADEVRFQEFLDLFDRLKELPKLQNVVLGVYRKFGIQGYGDIGRGQKTNRFRSATKSRFISSLSTFSRVRRELSIHDLPSVHETGSVAVSVLEKVLGGSQSLQLHILLEWDASITPEFLHKLPSFWLEPATSNLQHLALHSSEYVGLYPRLDFRNVHFPRLKTLSLRKYTFVDDSQLDWILSHCSTLTELYLDCCPIIFEVATYVIESTYLDISAFEPEPKPGLRGMHFASYETRLCDYFRALRGRLPLLRHSRYGKNHQWDPLTSIPFEHEEDIETGLTDESYLAYHHEIGPGIYTSNMCYNIMAPDGYRFWCGDRLLPSNEDRGALRELHATICQRVNTGSLITRLHG